MHGKRISIIVNVDTDGVPGWGDNPQDYVVHIQRLLTNTIPHYNPEVFFVGPREPLGGPMPKVLMSDIRKMSEEDYLRDIAPRLTSGELQIEYNHPS